MFADSSLFVLASALRSLLAEGIDALEHADVLIGTPKQAKEIVESAGQGPVHNLNLFFYRFEPETHPISTNDPGELYVRVHCLVTALAGKSAEGDNKGTIGQNDLRLLGEAMHVLHQHPQLTLSTPEGQANIQVVPIGLSLDQLHQIWAMAGPDAGYRPSAGYELALVPIPLGRASDRTPKVTRIDVEVEAGELVNLLDAGAET